MKRDYGPVLWQLMAYGMASWSLVYANPSNPTVAQGNASFEQSDAATLLITTSDKTHIFWEDFSIAECELTQIIQPSSHSVVVIQVENGVPSSLLGTLKANGHVFLINSNGTWIGANGCIDTNAFLVSTFPTCSCALLEGNEEVLFQGSSSATIVNEGRINALAKDVYLIGYQIENKGAIDASQGTVALAAGHDIILKPLNTQKLSLLPSFLKEESEETGIDNSGMITACKTELIADGNAYSVAIRHAGLIDAVGVKEHNSQVHLIAENGNNGIFGTIAAENADGTGGDIYILGEHIALFENSNIDASGDNGGGTIHIGQNEKGCFAKTAFVDEEVVISADALKSGNGGKVIIGSEEMTSFYGTISACGGDDSGDGGLIEIFGKCKLDFRGEIEHTAPHGKTGTLQMDLPTRPLSQEVY